jgi:hypothetical protein
MQLPKVGDVIEKLDRADNQRFYIVLENPHDRYYKMYNIVTGERSGWSMGWTEDAERRWKHEWRIV